MPKVLSLVLALAFLIATSVSAVEPQGFVLKLVYVDPQGEIQQDQLRQLSTGKIILFQKKEDCEKVKEYQQTVQEADQEGRPFQLACIAFTPVKDYI